jgi:hypothetical protein
MPTAAQIAAAGVVPGQSINPGGGNSANINALLGGIVDRKKWYWYDTLKIAPGATVVGTPYEFFQVPVGRSDPYLATAAPKTFLETNITGNGGQFSSPYDMVLTNLGFLFAPDNMKYDITQIWKYGYFEFRILEKKFFKGHVWRHPPGAGMSGYSTKNQEAVWNNGVPDPGAIFYFGQWSKYIPPLTEFGMNIQFLETVGVAMSGSNGGTLGADAIAAGQSGSALPTLLSNQQSGNGIWLIGFMNGLSDGPVQ